MEGGQLEAIPPLEYLDKLGAYAVSIGMPAKEYWYDDPQLINTYVGAEKIKQQKKNFELWLQGLYVYDAIGALVPVLNPFSKDHKAKKYIEKPIPLTDEERAEEQRLKEERFIKFMDRLTEAGKK